MKKAVNNLSIVLCYVILISFFAGCGLFFNPSKHVQAALDFVYKGEFDEYSKLNSVSIDQLKSEYEANYQERANQLAKFLSFVDKNGNVKMNESVRSQTVEFAKKLYSKANYKISDSVEKMGNYGYIVHASVSPIILFEDVKNKIQNFANEYNADITNGKYNDKNAYSEDDVNTIYQQGILDIINQNIDNVRYAEPQNVELRFIHTGRATTEGENTICEDDISELSKLIVKYPH